MTDSITPPRELAQQWLLEAHHKEAPPGTCPDTRILIARAAQWSADQELEACVEWLEQNQGRWEIPMALRDARRPKPPSLKEQALEVFEALIHGDASGLDVGVIRRALEALPE